MQRMLQRAAPVIYAVLRIVAGVLFAMHGAQKLFGVMGRGQVPIMSLPGAAGVIELVGGLLIALGFYTRLAAFIASGEMAVAYFLAHAPRGPNPLLNGGEVAVLYCFLFLYVASRGTVTLGIRK